MNTLKIISIIFLCGFAVTQNAHGMAPITLDTRLTQLSRSLMQNKSLANAIQVRNHANIIKIEAQDDMIGKRRAIDLERRAQGIINRYQAPQANRVLQKDPMRHAEMLENRTIDADMPDLAHMNLH